VGEYKSTYFNIPTLLHDFIASSSSVGFVCNSGSSSAVTFEMSPVWNRKMLVENGASLSVLESWTKQTVARPSLGPSFDHIDKKRNRD
jgi:hypothetical protein